MKIICKMVGHKPETGPLRRSPFTVNTHWRDTHCARCGQYLGSERMYFDALLRPDLFTRQYEEAST